jgi:hypothetical protein
MIIITIIIWFGSILTQQSLNSLGANYKFKTNEKIKTHKDTEQGD